MRVLITSKNVSLLIHNKTSCKIVSHWLPVTIMHHWFTSHLARWILISLKYISSFTIRSVKLLVRVPPSYPSLPVFCPFILVIPRVCSTRSCKQSSRERAREWQVKRERILGCPMRRHRVKTCGKMVLMRKKNLLSSRIEIDRESERRVSQKNLSFSSSPFPRLSTRIEVPRETHLTFFVSKEIIQLVTRHWNRKSQNNGKSFSS